MMSKEPSLADEPKSFRMARAMGWLVATWAIATPWLVGGDGPVALEVGALPALVWIGLAAWIFRPWQQSSGSRFLSIDGTVAVWMVWVVIATGVVWSAGWGWLRPAEALLVQAIGAAAVYALGRRVGSDRRATTALLALVFGGIGFLASHGAYQALIESPRTRAAYFQASEETKQRQLAEIGIARTEPESRERRLFEDRLRSTEPTATFSLTNSLAIVLGAGWFLGLHLLAPVAPNQVRMSSSTRSLAEWGAAIAIALALLIIAALLVLTKSRAAWLAVALATIPWMIGACRIVWVRRSAIAGGVVGVLLVIGAIATKQLDIQVLSEATKSFAYRIEYWRATGSMIADSPWVGVGPGSFQDRYREYQLPESSETVADPHNAWIEASAVSGIPAGLALLALVGLAIYGRWQVRQRRRRTASLGSPSLSKTSQRSWAPEDLETLFAFGLGTFLAVVSAIPLVLFQGLMPDLDAWFGSIIVPLIVALVVAWGTVRWVEYEERCGASGRVIAWQRGATGSAVLAMAIALLASGGYGFWGVASLVWGLLGIWGTLALESKRDVSDPPRESNERRFAAMFGAVHWIGWSAAVLTVLVGSLGVARPQYQGWWHRIGVQRGMMSGSSQRVASELLQWQQDQPSSEEPWQRQGEAALVRWLSVSGTAKDREAYLQAGVEYERRRPGNAGRFLGYGVGCLSAWRLRGEAEDLEMSLKFFQQASEKAPHDPLITSQLAYAWHLYGDSEQAAQVAERALELDRLNPHADRSLRLQSIWTGADPDPATAEQWMQELRSKATEMKDTFPL